MNKYVDDNGPGVVRTISGRLVDVVQPTDESLSIGDVAWGLGRTLRYNGHIKQDYTVAHHSVILSYYVPDQYRLEALLHDAAEAYLGDITHPLKQLWPAICDVEDRLLYFIMAKYGMGKLDYCLNHEECMYEMSEPVKEADHIIYAHECFSFGDRPGIYSHEMQTAWTEAVSDHIELWGAGQYPFLHRFFEVHGATKDKYRQRINKSVEVEWYGEPEGLKTMDEDRRAAIEAAAAELL